MRQLLGNVSQQLARSRDHIVTFGQDKQGLQKALDLAQRQAQEAATRAEQEQTTMHETLEKANRAQLQLQVLPPRSL